MTVLEFFLFEKGLFKKQFSALRILPEIDEIDQSVRSKIRPKANKLEYNKDPLLQANLIKTYSKAQLW